MGGTECKTQSRSQGVLGMSWLLYDPIERQMEGFNQKTKGTSVGLEHSEATAPLC